MAEVNRLRDSILASSCYIFFATLIYVLNEYSLINYEVVIPKIVLALSIYFTFVYLVNALAIMLKGRLSAIKHKDLVIMAFILLVIGFFSSQILSSLTISIIVMALFSLNFSLMLTYKYWGKYKRNTDRDSRAETNSKYIILAIFAAFLLVRLSVYCYYRGSYLDEYLHIFTGKSMFSPDIHQVYSNLSYDRGIYLSFLCGIFSKIFGNSIDAQKAIPICVSIANFYLLNRLSVKFLNKNISRYLLLVIYTVSPLVIFNDLYIRPYVFYELFCYVSIYLVLELIKSYSVKDFSQLKKIIIPLAIFDLCLLLTKEFEVLIFVLLQFAIVMTYLCYTWKEDIKISFFPKIKIKHHQVVISVVLLALIALALPKVREYAEFFLNGQSDYGVGSAERYNTLFYIELVAYTTVFVNGIYLCLKNEYNLYKKLFLSGVLFLFVLHQVISPDFRNTRGLFYFVPFFYLASMMVFETISIKRQSVKVICYVIFLITPALSIYKYLDYGPSVPKEIGYLPFVEYFKIVGEECQDRKIISIMHSNYIANYYGYKPDYILYFKKDNIENDIRYYYDNGRYYQNVDGNNVITDFDEAKELFENDKICVLLTKEFRHTGGYISSSQYSELFGDMQETEIKTLKLLKN